MVISFDDKEIRTICEDSDVAHVKLGSSVAISLQTRLSELIVADTVKDLPAGDPGELNDLCYKIELSEGNRLVFCSNHVKPPTIDGKINWAQVTRIKILKIERYND